MLRRTVSANLLRSRVPKVLGSRLRWSFKPENHPTSLSQRIGIGVNTTPPQPKNNT